MKIQFMNWHICILNTPLETINIYKHLWTFLSVSKHLISLPQTFLNKKGNLWICLGNVYGYKGPPFKVLTFIQNMLRVIFCH